MQNLGSLRCYHLRKLRKNLRNSNIKAKFKALFDMIFDLKY